MRVIRTIRPGAKTFSKKVFKGARNLTKVALNEESSTNCDVLLRSAINLGTPLFGLHEICVLIGLNG